MGEKKSFVKDYMTKNVISVSPDTETQKVIDLMKESRHNSYPVLDNGKLVGMVTAFDIVSKEWADTVSGIMSTKLVVANQNLSINDASRVMFRRGISRMPVVDSEGGLVGIITNTDMVRSHIERSTPNKVEYFKKTMEQLYGIKTTLRHMRVETNKLRPTQDRVYADELEGRAYELEKGLAEPAIVVKTGTDGFWLTDTTGQLHPLKEDMRPLIHMLLIWVRTSNWEWKKPPTRLESTTLMTSKSSMTTSIH